MLQVFSYLPNPRIWKATIAARIAGVPVEVRGASLGELADWLWDFDARPLTDVDRSNASLLRSPRTGVTQPLFKTDAFMDAHPFGTVPAAFGPDGRCGIFESNSIMRLVGRLAPVDTCLYGADAYEASRIDGFLDVALVFGRASQVYLFALLGNSVTGAIHAQATAAFDNYLAGIERALTTTGAFVVAEKLSLADICFVAELCLFSNERRHASVLSAKELAPIWHDRLHEDYPLSFAHFERLRQHDAFRPDVGPYLSKLDSLQR